MLFTLNIQNCHLFFYDGSENGNPGNSDVVVKFRAPFMGRAEYSVDSSTITVKSNADPGLCYIKIWIQPNVTIKSLEIKCSQYCSITQNAVQFNIQNNLIITGDQDVYANFAELAADSFTFNADQGYIQLNHVTLKSDSAIKLRRGDIIVQSSSSFATSFSVPNSSYCLSAPLAVSPTLGADCNASGSITEENFLKEGTLTCSGTANLCYDSTCTIGFSITTETQYGAFYGNVIVKGAQRTAPKSNQQAMGAPFDFGIRFDPNLTQAIQYFSETTSNQSNLSPEMIINLGSFDSQSSQYTKWVISSNPAYAYMKPWWLSTFSASLLSTSLTEQTGFLYPGYCPWKPVLDQFQLYGVQQLFENNNISSLATLVWDKTMPAPPYLTANDQTVQSGMLTPSTKRVGTVDDFWYSFSLTMNEGILMQDNNIDSNAYVLLALIFSLVVAAYSAFQIGRIIIVALSYLHYQIADSTKHVKRYSYLEKSLEKSEQDKRRFDPKSDSEVQTKEQPEIHQERIRKYSVTNLLLQAPPVSAFVDVLLVMIVRWFSNSPKRFYEILFTAVDQKQAHKYIQGPY